MEADLIPGLLDCVAFECLLRLPFHFIPDARAVCKRWKNELDSPSFFRIRRASGLTDFVLMLLFHLPYVGKLILALYEPATGVCMMRHLATNRPNDKKCCRIAMVVGRELVMIGGRDMLNRRTSDVHIYDLLSGTWRLGAPRPAPEQHFSRCGLKGDKICVISRRGTNPRSAHAYDVATDTWIEMPDLAQDPSNKSLFDGRDKVTLRTTNEKVVMYVPPIRNKVTLLRTAVKEIVVYVPREKPGEKVMAAEVTFDKDAIWNFRRILRLKLGVRMDNVVHSFYWL